jgi:phenylalanyl-tRNA synthetase beta chain
MPFVRGDDATHMRVLNPLTEEEPHLRRSILETLSRRAEYNLSRMQGNLRLFEIGSTFTPRGTPLPLEEIRVGVLLMGERRPRHFSEPPPPLFDAWDARALAERVASLAFPGEAVHLDGSGDALWVVRVGGERRAVGRVVALELDRPPWAAEPLGVEIALAVMPNDFVAPPGSHAHGEPGRLGRAAAARFRPLPVTPAVALDFALILPDGMTAATVERLLRSAGGELLESLALLDEYRGEHVPAGHRSVMWRLTFRDPVRTLREKEIEGRRQKILRTLESELGVRPRTA